MLSKKCTNWQKQDLESRYLLNIKARVDRL